jgi:formate dehydrogenase
LITLAGNPARSAPNSGRLEAALSRLDLMASVDTYLNETTRHAHVILPAPRLTTRGHFDLVNNQSASHNAARYSRPLVPLAPHERSEREIMLLLAAATRGDSLDQDLEKADDAVAEGLARRLCGPSGTDPAVAMQVVGSRRGAERLLDLHLRSGPYGDGFGARPDGLTLDVLIRHPDGVDLGPPRSRLPDVLRTPSGRVELAPPLLVADVERVRAGRAEPPPAIVLIGRRQVRGMNSWLHNALPATWSGPCILHVHPDDAERTGLENGAQAIVRSRTG